MKPYKKIALLYLLFGALWIFLSDRIISFFVSSTDTLTVLQTYKGWFFIIITSTLLYYLMRRMYYKIVEKENEKEQIFTTTMSAVHHILNNFLHKMMFFKYQAEDNKEFKQETLDLYEQVISDTSKKIMELSHITNITKEEIVKTVYPT